jgi:hypothetical protein
MRRYIVTGVRARGRTACKPHANPTPARGAAGVVPQAAEGRSLIFAIFKKLGVKA